MEVREFERLLHIGLGRAVLFLKEHDATPYRDAILHACLHDVGFDRQFEPSRAQYLWEIARLTGEEAFYRKQVLTALPVMAADEESDHYDVEQLLELAGVFAAHGDEEARRLLYEQFAANVTRDGDDAGAYPIIDLDGIEGFLFVADQFAARALAEEDSWIAGYLLEHVEWECGVEETWAALERASSDNPRIAWYAERMRGARARPRDNHRIDASNLEYDEVKQQIGRVDFTTLRYEHLRQYIIDRGERVPRGYLFRWGENASDEVLAQAAADLLEETEPGRQLSYLRIFNHRRFPLDHRKLLELGQGSDEDVVFWALRVLKQIAHPSVRALSLRLLEARQSLAGAVGLLLSNYQDGDYALVEAAIRAEQDENELYRLGYDMRQVVEEHPAPDAAGALLQLYEKEPVGYRRKKTVHLMIWLDVLPEWVREECRHDGNPGIRELIAEEQNVYKYRENLDDGAAE